MIKLFVDDSGSDAGSELFVIAGWISTDEKWAEFIPKWSRILNEEPAVSYFKASEVFAKPRRRAFAAWSDAQAYDRVFKLSKLIGDTVLCGVSAGVLAREYRSLLKGRVSQNYDNPYYLLFPFVVECASVAHQHLVTERLIGVDTKIDVVFDEQPGFHKARDLFRFVGGDHIGEVTFEPDSDAIPLQAADMLAWKLRRHSLDERAFNPALFAGFQKAFVIVPSTLSGPGGLSIQPGLNLSPGLAPGGFAARTHEQWAEMMIREFPKVLGENVEQGKVARRTVGPRLPRKKT